MPLSPGECVSVGREPLGRGPTVGAVGGGWGTVAGIVVRVWNKRP